MSLEKQIMEDLTSKGSCVFCIKDMASFGDYKSIAKAIERLTMKGIVRRVINGIYYYPLINQTFNMEYPPEIDDIASAIARNNNWDVRATGSTALYKIGLDNQIPMKYIYLSSGPYRSYVIGNREIIFKNASQKNFAFSKKDSLIIQAMKELGDGNISNSDIDKMSSFLSIDDKNALVDSISFAPVWMHSFIRKIGDSCNE